MYFSRNERRRKRFGCRLRCARRFVRPIGEALESRELLTGTASINGVVWNDLDGDGARGASEPAAVGITVYLDLNDNDGLDAGEPTQMTAADGGYSFQNLDAGNYVVREKTPANYRITSPQASGQRLFAIQSGSPPKIVEVDIATGAQKNIFSAPSGTSTLHSGLAFDGQSLWFMADSNDTLYKLNPSTGAVLGSTVLPSGGYGSLAALGGKIYVLNSSSRQAISIFDPSTSTITGTLTLQAGVGVGSGMQDSLGESVATNELVFASYYRVNFLDATTGIQTHSFDISYGFDVKAVEAVGNEILVDHTNSSNIEVYNRSGKLLRTITLGFAPQESAAYADLSGANRLALAAGQAATNVNFGEQSALGSIGGTRWYDANGNGVRDSGEAPLSGKTMYLDLNDNGSRDAGEPTTVTAGNGSYLFSNLAEGSYVVREEVESGSSQTYPANTQDRLFAYSYVPSKIYELNPATGAILNTFNAPNDGYLAIAFDGKTLYAVSETNGNLYKINPDTGAVLASAVLGGGTYEGLAYENGMLYSYPIGDEFTTIDPVTMKVSGTLALNSNDGVFWNIGQMTGPDRILGLNTFTQLVQIDPVTGAQSVGYTVAGTASVISVGGSGSKLYASDNGGHINVYSAAGALLQTLSFAQSIHSMTMFPGAGGAQRIALAAGQSVIGADFGTNEPLPPPATAPDSYSTLEDTDLSVAAPGLLQNDTDAAGLSLTAVKDTDPAHGTLTLNADGSFLYHPNANYSGPDSFMYHARNSAAAGSIVTVTLTVTEVNDPPSFAKGLDASATDESPAQAISGWATAISAGPADEATQHVHFVIQSNTKTSLFAAGPTIDATGKLTFTPAPNVSGSAQISIVLVDDGGTANGGVDSSQPQTFTISVAKARPWYNAANALDVTGDGHVVALDALIVINFVNAFGAVKVPAVAGAEAPYYDVNGDGSVVPGDALAVINHVNAFGDSEGEGDDAPAATGLQPLAVDLLGLLALDIALQSKRRRG